MEIHNRLDNLHVNQRPAAGEAAGADDASPSSDDASSKELYLSIKGIVLQLQTLPELRESLVATGRERASSGEYLTLDAAKATADAILG